MTRLAVPDAGWLPIEGRERPMHVGGLQVFRPPEDAPPTFLHDLAQSLQQDAGVRAPFSERLEQATGT